MFDSALRSEISRNGRESHHDFSPWAVSVPEGESGAAAESKEADPWGG